MSRLGLTALVLVVLAVALPAHAASLTIWATTSERGWVALAVSGPDGASVQITESGQPVATVTLQGGRATVEHAAPWACDRFARTFTAATADGAETTSAEIRTPSCSKRLALSVKAVNRGKVRRVEARVVDTFGTGGVAARVCPDRRRCRSVAMAAGRTTARRAYRATRDPGVWTVQLRTAWGQTVERTAYVRPRGVLKVLATGDSMIQYVDLSLRKRLAKRARVRSDAHVSTGLSKPALLDWVKYAKRQAKSRPAVTVMFIGANDGFPIGGHNCCSSAWIDAYAARARSMMQTYARRGRGVVYWLSLPAPRPAQWRRIYPAVNKALFKAAAGLGPAVRVINLGKTFTPHGFRAQMTWKGRRLTVRQADGVHLNQAGASIAAGLVQRAMRADGVL